MVGSTIGVGLSIGPDIYNLMTSESEEEHKKALKGLTSSVGGLAGSAAAGATATVVLLFTVTATGPVAFGVVLLANFAGSYIGSNVAESLFDKVTEAF